MRRARCTKSVNEREELLARGCAHRCDAGAEECANLRNVRTDRVKGELPEAFWIVVPESLVVQLDARADRDEQVRFMREACDKILGLLRDRKSCNGVVEQEVMGEREEVSLRRTCWCRPFCEDVRAKKIGEKRAGCRIVGHCCCAGDAECTLLHHCVGGAPQDEFSCVAVAVVADDAFLPVPVEE